MKRITLLRHSYAIDHHDLGDFSRTLSEEGKIVAKKQAILYQKEMISLPDAIISSDSVRTQETVLIFLENWDEEIPCIYTPSLYNSNLVAYLNALSDLDDTIEHIMIVGHNPTISMLLLQLDDSQLSNMRPCEYAFVDVQIDTWKTLLRYA